MRYSTILIISDTHFPYHHRDTIPFLKKLKRDIDFDVSKDLCVHIGDEISASAWSYHEKDQSLVNADKELELATECMKELYKLFPYCTVIESNHGSLAKRKAKSGGIPTYWLKSYKDALQAPDGWQWVPSFRADLPSGQPVNFFHGLRSNAFAEALTLGESLVQGHHHTQLNVRKEYVHALKKTIFALQVGCLVDDKSPEFDYNKNIAKRPALGCGVILNGNPIPILMPLNHHGRWLGGIS